MMLLYHIQNPDAPKFIPNCNRCHADILVGNRFRCDACDVDICQMCISSFGKTVHAHPLRVINMGTNQLPQQLTEEQKKERQKNIQLHLQLLLHASSCVNKECASRNCFKMKVSCWKKWSNINAFQWLLTLYFWFICLFFSNSCNTEKPVRWPRRRDATFAKEFRTCCSYMPDSAEMTSATSCIAKLSRICSSKS